MTTPILFCNAITFGYEPEKPVVRSLSLGLEEGSYTLLVGPSGEGKSSLFRLLVRLEEPTSGNIVFQGQPITALAPAELRRQVGLLGQTPALVPGTVKENLLLPFSFAAHRARPLPTDQELHTWLERLGLGTVPLTQEASALSVGQRQRLCLIRLLLLRPKVLLLDEPTSALDAESRATLLALVEELWRSEGLTVVQIDHSGYSPTFPHTVLALRAGHMEQTHVA